MAGDLTQMDQEAWVDQRGEGLPCTTCGERLWWDYGMWRSWENAGVCPAVPAVDKLGRHRPNIPDLAVPTDVERWLGE